MLPLLHLQRPSPDLEHPIPNTMQTPRDLSPGIFFYDCYRQRPQTLWLQTQINCLTVLEVRNPKSVCQEGHDPHRGSGEEPFLPHLSFWWLVNCWHFSACSYSTSIFVSIIVWHSPLVSPCFHVCSPLLIKTTVIWD